MAADRLNYAGFWRRLVAFMVDTVIYSLVLVAGAHLLGAVESLPWQFDVFAYALALSYYALCECSQWQGTIGKRIYRLRVTGLDGGRLNIGQALRRNVYKHLFGAVPIAAGVAVGPPAGAVLVLLGVAVIAGGYLAIAFTGRKQGWYDMAAGALVIIDDDREGRDQ